MRPIWLHHAVSRLIERLDSVINFPKAPLRVVQRVSCRPDGTNTFGGPRGSSITDVFAFVGCGVHRLRWVVR